MIFVIVEGSGKYERRRAGLGIRENDNGTVNDTCPKILTKIISVQNEVTDKLVKFNRLGLSRFDGDQLNFFEGRVWTRKTSIQLKSSLGQVEPDQTDRTDQPIDKTKSLFSITKSNYRLQSNSDTLTIQLS